MSKEFPENQKTFKGKTAEKRFSLWKNKNDVLIRKVNRVNEPYTDSYIIGVQFDYNSCYGKGY